jgi:transcriptional regulator with XRE-family HTH domain
MEQKSYLAKNIKKIRLFKGLNQQEFADLLTLKRHSIGAYEEGRAEPKLETLIHISNFFQLSIDDLVKSDLTVNKIAKFEHPKSTTANLADLHEKIDTIFRRIDLIDKKITNQFKKED